MKLTGLLILLAFSPLAFSVDDSVNEILTSKTQRCAKTLSLYNEMKDKQVFDTIRGNMIVYKVSGMMDNGQNVLLTLTKRYICDYGSFGGGGCATKYSCDSELY